MKSGKEIFKSYFDNENLLELLDYFYEIHKNAPINLTAIKDYDDFYIKHYLDSLYIFKIYNLNFQLLIDIGSGGGFPGIPIALLYPDRNIILVESIKKKADFLRVATKELGLKNVEVINDRCENMRNIYPDFITARGVATVDKLFKWTRNVSRETKCFLFYKGEKVDEEIKNVQKFINKNDMRVEYVRMEEPFKRTYTIIYRNDYSLCPRKTD
ncbi:16S rRNA (guanine(527)-N(7))-methyltransferase RsmG [Deferribacter autotrophicus]|uniref:Ribosomal RNA small subunit methyltransferase G n=1 Tax=Deferribacter autotrophicus TaxID=500465 RepID=A0A5A8F480_9BACT|nr:16S rRNA (guanine(527)-N(7))-methyltransferase RsmG [Deferribacter autotrophicus]KAA0258846.1 16S rRNA (guanine(527)-N(7))-methyltransferase RsmG [Deferribacter autotrophicus]